MRSLVSLSRRVAVGQKSPKLPLQALRSRSFADAASPTVMTVNFSTPHAPIYKKKEVKMVILPGESGDFGLTAGHMPYIAQLQAGVVTITHTDDKSEKFFVPGGFSVTNSNSVTDISVTEAFSMDDFDESSVKAALDKANDTYAKATDPAEKAKALIEMQLFGNLTRALGSH